MQDWEFWLLLVLYLAIPAVIFISRNWIKARIEQSVRSGFEAKLEALRSDLRRSEEELKSELRSKEAQITALRDGIFSGRTQRQALVDKRRLEAIDGLWAAFTTLTPFTFVSKMMGSINFDAAARQVHQHPNMQQFFRMISGGDQTENLAKMAQHSGRSQQPFVSPLAWAYFSAYQTVVVGAYIRAKVLEIGMEGANELITDEPIKNVLKTALPHYSQFIDEQPVGAYHLLLDDLEKHLIAELQKMIHGDEQDQASVEQAARIMEMVQKASAKQAEQEVGAAAALS
jgi:DNA-binding protein Fis